MAECSRINNPLLCKRGRAGSPLLAVMGLWSNRPKKQKDEFVIKAYTALAARNRVFLIENVTVYTEVSPSLNTTSTKNSLVRSRTLAVMLFHLPGVF